MSYWDRPSPKGYRSAYWRVREMLDTPRPAQYKYGNPNPQPDAPEPVRAEPDPARSLDRRGTDPRRRR